MANESTAAAQARFDRALSFLRNGDAQTTVDLCRSRLDEQPDDGKMRVLLGTALVRQRQFDTAERELRQVIKRWPDIPKAHRELGLALFGQGRFEEGVACYRRVVELTPKRSAAHFDLSVALAKLGREDEARKALEESFRQDPRRKEMLDAFQAQQARKFEEARTLYQKVLRREPSNVHATRLLGAVEIELGRYRKAERRLRTAVAMDPEYFAAWTDFARALIEQEKFDEASDALERAIRLEPESAYPRALLGNMLSRAGQYEQAISEYRTALDKQPTHGGSLAGLGHALKTIGRQNEAVDTYRKCIREYPAFGEAYWSLANLKTFRFTDEELATMKKHVDSDKLLEETRVNLNYALGKAYEDRGNYDDAFFRYSRGASLRRVNESYDPVETETIHDRIIETLTAEFLAANSGRGDPDPAPIFIVGLPRSGSTLLEQILASHSQVDGTHELPDLARIIRTINENRRRDGAYPEALLRYDANRLAELGRQYLNSTQRYRGGGPFFTDKMPNNFALIGLIHLILPNAKIVNARRHPLDSCMGSFKQLFYKGQSFTYDLVELGEYYLQYQRLMDHWHAALPGKVLDVCYEEMVRDQERETRRLLAHCGLPWEDGCLEFYKTDRAVNTASSEQVRQPIYAGSIDAWRRFEAHLGPLIEVLEPLLVSMPEASQPACLRDDSS